MTAPVTPLPPALPPAVRRAVVIPVLGATAAAAAQPAPRGWPLWRQGFRPFYLGAALFGALAVPLWVALLLGALPVSLPVAPLLWHAHEMLFGFAAAVIVGFLLTAGQAWTGLSTPRGPLLAGLALLWLAARGTALLGPYALHAALDLALLPLVAGVLVDRLLRAGKRRNLPLAGLLLALAAANGVFHAAVLGWLDAAPLQPLHAGLALVMMIECVMAGRVIPAFTMSALPGVRLQVPGWLETSALATTAAGLALWVLVPPGPAGALVLGAAALLQAARLLRWQPLRTRGRPILWVLHAAYAWVPVGLALLALAQVGVLPGSAGLHALAVGATGGLIIGMVTRTARGHTGRPLAVGRWEVAAYALVIVAALLRVALPLLPAALWAPALILAAVAWAAAFGLYLMVYTPWLLTTRLDGKDG